jgi:hypothetical protein
VSPVVTAARPLHLDNVGPECGQVDAHQGAADVVGQLDYTHSGQHTH